MKDYSLNSEQKKDFILGYEPINDGDIAVKYAEGEPLPMPYTEKNEQMILNKMKEQVRNSSEFENKMIQKKKDYFRLLIVYIVYFLTFACLPLFNIYPVIFTCAASIMGALCLLPGVSFIRAKLKLKDLEKNKRFLEIGKTVNDNARNINQNALANVSKKTKDFIEEVSVDEPVFNINSFNYVPFKDLEQIVENVERNERFGFEYDSEEHVLTRKKTRKM